MLVTNTTKKIALGILAIATCLTSCSEDNKGFEGDRPMVKDVFHVATDVTDPDENVSVFMQPTTNVTDTTLTFINNGYEMDGERSARVLTAGGRIYNLNYGTGQIYELEHNGTSSYNKVSEIDISHLVGTHPRYAEISDNMLLAHNVVETFNEENTEVTVTLQIVKISIPGLYFNATTDFVEHDLGTYKIGEAYVNRVDAPVIMGNKLFYGTQYRLLGQPNNGEPNTERPDEMATLVVDYPSLENYKIVTSDASIGDTYGYRGKSMYVYNNHIYQVNMTTEGSDAVILRLNREGEYDQNYVFNIANQLGQSVGTINWHHVGNGRGYIAIDDISIDHNNSYDMAYIDVEKQEIEILHDVPKSDMWFYQSGAVHEGKFHIAISPIGAEAYIWEFDGYKTRKGAKLDGGNIYVQGIYK
ncbi:hypothetical protein [Sediminitomix flava]|uniref:DUF4374 domain-containing protein n=1 Tax=Sediminitomix flava TaxID=379075 RepID=A0A315Z884_SEDFL|nr:hypothetical protein [Sediminitomix flava]PWJ41775.1 hypothetical protein BC781_10325 [Sediminitomix flava]